MRATRGLLGLQVIRRGCYVMLLLGLSYGCCLVAAEAVNTVLLGRGAYLYQQPTCTRMNPITLIHIYYNHTNDTLIFQSH